jgi:hypothetical protein
MPTLSAIVHWLDTHALSIALALATLTGILRAAYALASRVLAPYPRARAFVEAVAAMAPDVLRFLQQVYRVLTGRDLPSTQPVSVMPPTPTVALPAEKQGALDVLATRPSVAPPAPTPAEGSDPVDEPEPFDPQARRTITPADRQRGSVDVRSLLAVVVGLSVVLPLGVALSGCPRNPPVSGCQPEAQTCIADAPHVCSASQRWHRAGDLTCAQVGGVCTVLGGRAFCADAADAGADAGDVE